VLTRRQRRRNRIDLLILRCLRTLFLPDRVTVAPLCACSSTARGFTDQLAGRTTTATRDGE
jgi:hypothetical protein